MCTSVCMNVYIPCACLVPGEGRDNRMKDGCDPPCWCWESNPGSLEEHQVLLTNEPTLYPLNVLVYYLLFETGFEYL